MGDSNFSGLIRSGASHSVSVSKHTGNAKNPKNIFNSEIDEAAAKKAAPKKHHAIESNGNSQRVDAEDRATNVQYVELEETPEHLQNVGHAIDAPNLQVLDNDLDLSVNRQAIFTQSPSDNLQKFDNNSTTENVQRIGVQNIAQNRQGLINEAVAVNTQALPPDNSAFNQQFIATQTNAVNRQSLEISGPAGLNRQQMDQDNFKDHFEVLPSDTIDRTRVDVGISVSQNRMEAQKTSPAVHVKRDDPAAMVKGLLTTQQVAKQKRDAFHGRLAGIKRDVGSISLKLDAMEKSI
jgi:hypothetical protein